MIDFKMTKEGLILLIRDYQNLEEVLNEITSRVTQMGGSLRRETEYPS